VRKTDENNVSVIHLVWLPYGTEMFRNFLSSYCKYNSGYPHHLVLLFNGVASEQETAEFLKIIDEKKVDYKPLVKYGFCQDLDAYFWAAGQLQSDHLLFLNSYAEFLSEDWLKKYMEFSKREDIGLIGATGSWQSYYRSVFINNRWKWEGDKSWSENYAKFKLLIKASIYWRFLFPDFPNPHIRTNAFFIRRQLMLQLKRIPLRKKLDAYRMESGYESITRQILKKGKGCIIIDKFGNPYGIKEWAKAKIFWTENQEELLVADNQTKKYQVGDAQTRENLSYHAWGNRDRVPD